MTQVQFQLIETLGKSLLKSMNSKGPSTDPRGTPDVIFCHSLQYIGICLRGMT